MSSAFTFGTRLVAAATLAIAFVAAGVPVAAQTTGQVKGKVVDGKGEPVDKAVVTIEFKGGTNMVREVKTNKRGEFIQVGLPPGPYWVTAKADAGQAADQVQVGLGTAPTMNLTLKPATKGMSAEETAFRKAFDEGVEAAGAKTHDAAIAKFAEAVKMHMPDKQVFAIIWRRVIDSSQLRHPTVDQTIGLACTAPTNASP